MGWLSLEGSLALPPPSLAARHVSRGTGWGLSPRASGDSLTCATESWGCQRN